MDGNAKLNAIVSRLEREAQTRVQKRASIEERVHSDLRQYHGLYDEQTEKEIGDKSRIFVNLTGPKTDAMAARLQDLLFPTDDRNWGIGPTRVPDLENRARLAAEAQAKIREGLRQAEEAAASGDADGAAEADPLKLSMQEADRIAEGLRAQTEEAKRRAEAMADVMEDQLTECRYHAVMRDVIEDACKVGTGIVKGPVAGDKTRRRWALTNGQFSVQREEGVDPTAPKFEHVDFWGFFPDLDVRRVEDSNGIFERHMMTEARLRRLQHEPGFDKAALAEILRAKPAKAAPNYMIRLRALASDGAGESTADFYEVWEYSGPLTAEEMQGLAAFTGDDETASEMQEVDPLQEVQARVWFCQGRLLKFALYPYDTGEPLYSVFNLKKDEASLFGFGVPYMLRDAQSMLNGAARMMMDNAGITAGPQILLDRLQLTPADGSYQIRPFKIWYAKDGIPKDEDYFRTYHMESHQAELAAIMAIAQKHIDDETGLTALAQGDQGSGITKTAQGMSILINATNVIFRRIVKNFDDDVTVPNIGRLYDWNMQFHPRDEIKGDFEVDARGSSVLLAREMQAQNLRMFALEFGSHPVYGAMIKHASILRKTAQANMLPVDDAVKSDREIEDDMERQRKEAEQALAMQQQAQQAQPVAGMTPEQQAIEMRKLDLAEQKQFIEAETANADRQRDYDVKLIERDTAMFRLAETQNFEAEKLAMMLGDKAEDRAFKAKQIAVETIMKRETGHSAGGII